MTLTKGLFLFDNLSVVSLSNNGMGGSTYVNSGEIFAMTANSAILVAVLSTLVLVWVAALFTHLESITSTQTSTETLLNEVENEMGNVYDLQLPVESLTVTFVTTLGLVVLTPVISTALSPTLLFNTLFTVACLLTPPTLLCFLYGRYLFNYIKGASTKNTLVTNFLLDGIALAAFFTRFLLQMLRYVLVLVKLALVGGFIHQLTTAYGGGSSLRGSSAVLQEGPAVSTLTSLLDICVATLHFIFEMLETFLIYYAQTGALGIVVVWLLSALYSYGTPAAKVRWFHTSRQ